MKYEVQRRVRGVWCAVWIYACDLRRSCARFDDKMFADDFLSAMCALGWRGEELRIVEVSE